MEELSSLGTIEHITLFFSLLRPGNAEQMYSKHLSDYQTPLQIVSLTLSLYEVVEK